MKEQNAHEMLVQQNYEELKKAYGKLSAMKLGFLPLGIIAAAAAFFNIFISILMAVLAAAYSMYGIQGARRSFARRFFELRVRTGLDKQLRNVEDGPDKDALWQQIEEAVLIPLPRKKADFVPRCSVRGISMGKEGYAVTLCDVNIQNWAERLSLLKIPAPRGVWVRIDTGSSRESGWLLVDKQALPEAERRAWFNAHPDWERVQPEEKWLEDAFHLYIKKGSEARPSPALLRSVRSMKAEGNRLCLGADGRGLCAFAAGKALSPNKALAVLPTPKQLESSPLPELSPLLVMAAGLRHADEAQKAGK